MLRLRPKTTVAAPKMPTQTSMVFPARRLMRIDEQGERDGERAERGHGAQQAEAVGAGVQDVGREDGHERGGAAEQDGEEVERDGAEQKPRAET